MSLSLNQKAVTLNSFIFTSIGWNYRNGVHLFTLIAFQGSYISHFQSIRSSKLYKKTYTIGLQLYTEIEISINQICYAARYKAGVGKCFIKITLHVLLSDLIAYIHWTPFLQVSIPYIEYKIGHIWFKFKLIYLKKSVINHRSFLTLCEIVVSN